MRWRAVVLITAFLMAGVPSADAAPERQTFLVGVYTGLQHPQLDVGFVVKTWLRNIPPTPSDGMVCGYELPFLSEVRTRRGSYGLVYSDQEPPTAYRLVGIVATCPSFFVDTVFVAESLDPA